MSTKKTNGHEHALQDQALARFRRSQRQGAWLYLEKDQLVQEVAATVENPYLVYQERAILSGVAAVIFELARRQPLRYVALCQELYESGAFVSNGRLLEPSPQLRKSCPPKAMRSVDWLLMSTMRDVEMTMFPHPTEELPVAIENPVPLQGWLKELLGFTQTHFVSTAVFGAFEALQQAIEAVKQGGIVFVLVDVGIFGMAEKPILRHPNHWLTFISATELLLPTMTTFTFTCHSWGRRYQLQLDRTTFEENVLGMLFAQRDVDVSEQI